MALGRSIVSPCLLAAATLGTLLVESADAHAAPPSARTDVTTTVKRARAPWITTTAASLRVTPRTPVPDVDRAARRAITQASATRLGAGALVRTGIDHFGDGDVLVRYGQSHRGLPVIGRGATVRFARKAEDRAITTIDLASDLPATTTPRVDAAAAAKAAARFTPLGATPKDAYLVVWPTRTAARLAWVVLPEPHGLPTAPRIVVDAEDGRILEAQDLVRFANAQVYASNPVRSPETSLREIPVAPNGATLTSDVLNAVNCIDRQTVKSVSFFGFKQNVHVCDLEQIATADANGDFVYTPLDTPGAQEAKSDAFSEVSLYYHASVAYSFFRGLQGNAGTVTSDVPLLLVANLQLPPGITSGSFANAADPEKPLEPFSNAFFSPASGGLGDLFGQLYGVKGGALWFGQGPKRDYAYDGDVVYHELAHAVVDNTLKLGAWTIDAFGAIDAPGAMNEGLADYFSAAITGDPDVGEYASADMSPDAEVIRTLANEDRCPTALVGEVHHDSTVFSGGLWAARQVLASGDKSKLDAAIYKAMRTNPGRADLGFDDAVNLFLATLATDFPAGAAALEPMMQNRGVLPACERVLVAPPNGTPIHSTERRLGFAAPGGPSLGVSGLAPGIVQVKSKLAPRATQVTLAFTAKSSGGGNPFGGDAKFTPVVIAKFGKAITWTEGKSGVVDDGDVRRELAEGEGALSATFDVPPSDGETEVFFQIANAGDGDGSYDALSVSFVPGEPELPAPAPEDAAGADAAPDAADDACGCRTPGRSPTPTAFAALAVGAALVAAGARRRRRAP